MLQRMEIQRRQSIVAPKQCFFDRASATVGWRVEASTRAIQYHTAQAATLLPIACLLTGVPPPKALKLVRDSKSTTPQLQQLLGDSLMSIVDASVRPGSKEVDCAEAATAYQAAIAHVGYSMSAAGNAPLLFNCGRAQQCSGQY